MKACQHAKQQCDRCLTVKQVPYYSRNRKDAVPAFLDETKCNISLNTVNSFPLNEHTSCPLPKYHALKKNKMMTD